MLFLLSISEEDVFQHPLVSGATKLVLYFKKKKLLEKNFRNSERFIFV